MGATSENLRTKNATWWPPFRRLKRIDGQPNESQRRTAAAADYITDDSRAEGFQTIIELTVGTADKAVPCVLKSETFDDFLTNAGLHLVMDEAVQVSFQYNRLMSGGRSFGVPAHNNPLEYDRAVFVVAANHTIYMNRAAHLHFDGSFTAFKKQHGRVGS